jgi:hypothetical protein
MLAIFGIGDGALSLVINLLVLFLIVTYLALIYWTYMDAKRRLEDPVLIACATAASFFPFIGTVVYTILRPPEFKEDREERELELRAAELRLRQLIEQSCPHCEYPVENDYLRCPNCERRLRSPCRKCTKPLDPKWGICPYCETEVRRRERGSSREGGRAPRADRSTRSERSTRPARSGSGERASNAGERSEQRDGQRRQQRPAVGAQGQGSGSGGSGSGGSRQQRPSGGGSQRSSS